MAIDFSKVKTITIPEGSVKKITDSAGNILWKEKTAEWHTIWEGTVTNSESKKITLSDLIGTVTLRVTWSYSTSGGNSNYIRSYYNNNGSTTTTIKPDSPFQFDLNADSTRYYIVGIKWWNGSDGRFGRACYLYWNNKDRYFGLQNIYSSNPTNAEVTLKITKIEQYY